MGIKLQDKPTLWDHWTGRVFPKSPIAMIFAEEVSSYNPNYLAVYFSLPQNGEHKEITAIYLSGEIRRYPIQDQNKELYLSKYFSEFCAHEKRPFFVINGDTNILSRLQLSGKDWASLRGRDVAFYFFEPLFVRKENHSRVPTLFSQECDVYFPELHWLEDFLRNHRHSFKAKTYVCDYGLEDFLKKKTLHGDLNVKTWDIFLLTSLEMLRTFERRRDPLYYKVPYAFSTAIEKKFICPNYRFEGFRQIVAGFVQAQDYAEEGILSFFHRFNEEVFRQDLSFAPEKLKHWPQVKQGIEKMQARLPLTFDTRNSKVIEDSSGFGLPDADNTSNLRKNAELYTHYNKAFLALVNESRFFTPCGEISEKALLPMAYMRPFLIFGGPYMLRYLREMGFETFSKYWDESYDEIEDHQLRLEALLDLTHDLLSQPLSKMQTMLADMEPLLRRNRRHLFLTYPQKMYNILAEEQRTKS